MSTIKKAQRYFAGVNFTSPNGTSTETAIAVYSNLKKIYSLTDEEAFKKVALILMKKLGPDFFKSRDGGNTTEVEIKTDEVPYEFSIEPYGFNQKTANASAINTSPPSTTNMSQRVLSNADRNSEINQHNASAINYTPPSKYMSQREYMESLQ